MEDRLTINKQYAANYAQRKRAEELSKLKDKYGDVEESESSSSEEEDDNADGVTTTVERNFLRTLSLIKSRDPQIYNKEMQFYSTSGTDQQLKQTSTKPMYLRDYERKRLLERESMAEVSDSEEDKPSIQPTYSEEQEQLKKSFHCAVGEMDDNDVLTVRHKSREEKDQEERDYSEWLKGQRSNISFTNSKEMDALRCYWSDPSLDPDEQFLRDYILNRGYIDPDSARIPTYDEIVGGDDEEDEDAEAVEVQEDFERKYNFRFEEPEGVLILSYPRTVGGSVRREDDRRKKKRKEKKERIEQEKERKKQELRRLKNLKRQEIMEKLEKLKEISGDSVDLNVEDIDGDFDPARYDQAMAKAFGEEYYDQEDMEGKPVFSDMEDEWGNEGGGGENGPHCEDPEFNMDADYIPETAPDRKHGRKGSYFGRAVSRHKPDFDPNEKTFEEYFDEYYKLDYEDLIGDIPCRFQYRSVLPNNFGLTTEEILKCDDKQLNQWVSLKKSVQYRTEEEEKKDKVKYRKKSKDTKKKFRVLHSLQDASTESRGKGGRVARPKKRKTLANQLRGKGKLSHARMLSYGLGRRK